MVVGEHFIFRNTSDALDFDFHGIVRVRLENATSNDVDGVARQLGAAPEPSSSEDPAHIVVHHESRRIEPPDDAWIVGAESAADSQHLYVRNQGKTGWTRFRFHSDDTIEIHRAQHSGGVNLLTQLLAHVARQRGYLAIHASGFVWRDQGVLVMGWSKGGKTELILPFMENGATFIGDEWMFVSEDGTRMIGLHEPIRIWDWHLTDLDGLRERLPSRGRRRLRLTAAAESMLTLVARGPIRSIKAIQKLSTLANRQRYVQIRPEVLWPDGCGQDVPIHRVLLTVSYPGNDVTTASIEPEDVARRMAISNIEEMRPLTLKLAEMRYRDPEMFTPSVLDVDEEASRLAKALAGIPSTLLTHPYPAPTRLMFEHVRDAL